MDIYKIMIVDDEEDIREGIVNRIDWAALGFSVAVEAENGQDALDKAESTPIDVVLTDIKMPFMDGLAMCEQLRRMYPMVKIIILTGFNEFEFAKTAIKLNVVEYVLKPVNVMELSGIMKRVHRQLEADIEEKRDVDALRASYEQALPLMRENFLNELLWKNMDRQTLDEQAGRYGVSLGRRACQFVAVFEVEQGSAPGIDWELAPMSVKQTIEEALANVCDLELFISTASVIVISGWDESDAVAASELTRMANEVCIRCSKLFSLSVTAGIGRAAEGMDGIPQSFQEARAALEYKAESGPGRAIYIQDMEQGGRAFDNQSENQLMSVIKFGTYDQILMHIEEMHRRVDSGSEWEQQTFVLDVLNSLSRIIMRYGLHTERVITERLQAILADREGWLNGPKLRERLCMVCFCMSEILVAKRVTASRTLVDEAKRYINGHYQDSELSLERICKHLHVSQTYFSSLFKQEENISYVRYLTELRLSRAVTLLEETDYKTYVIARMVGYEEPNYFSYVFKKRFGISPTKFRKQKDEIYDNVSE